MTVTKFEVAEEHLVIAIRLFFNEESEVSLYTLIRASHEILESLCKHNNLEDSILSEGIRLYVKPEFQKEVIRKISEAKGYFKHADRDPERALSWNPKVSEFFIWDATTLYRRLVKTQIPPEILIYLLWFRANHQNLWNDSENLKDIIIQLDTLAGISKKEFFESSMSILNIKTALAEKLSETLRLQK